jgi:hypothetical protein
MTEQFAYRLDVHALRDQERDRAMELWSTNTDREMLMAVSLR